MTKGGNGGSHNKTSKVGLKVKSKVKERLTFPVAGESLTINCL